MVFALVSSKKAYSREFLCRGGTTRKGAEWGLNILMDNEPTSIKSLKATTGAGRGKYAHYTIVSQ